MHSIVNCSHEIGCDDTPAEKQNLKPRRGDYKVRSMKQGTNYIKSKQV